MRFRATQQTKYYYDKDHKKKGIEYFISQLYENIVHLKRNDQIIFFSLDQGFKIDGDLTDKQYNLLESLYEKVMGAKDLPSCKLKHDFRKGLRY